jgi:adenine-specific DNA-methyltransferase
MNKPQLQLQIDDLQPSAEVWRPIHYLGSKLRLVEPLRLALDQVDPAHGRCVDLFAGSGTISAALSASRDVTAVDIQEYSRVLCSAVLNPVIFTEEDASVFRDSVAKQARSNQRAAASLIEYEERALDAARTGNPEPICELIDYASMVAFHESKPAVQPDLESAQRRAHKLVATDRTSLILRYYGGLFFSYRQATDLDALLAVAHRMPLARRDCFLAAIISTASEVVNTVGKHFAQPIRPRGSDGKPKRHLIAKIIRDREINLLELFAFWLDRYRALRPNGRSHQVIRADYADALASLKNVGAVYADPPYTRDHYSRFYHVLETMCLWDDPGVSTTRIRADKETFSRGMYRADRHQSPFCIKSQAPAAFGKLFASVKRLNAPLVLSYSPYANGDSHPRVMSVYQIETLAKEHFRSVEIISAGKFSHMKLNASRMHLDASAEAELIFICR